MTPTPEPPTSALPTLGKYQLTRKIAQSNDIVWEGRDPQVNRRVAVKELALPPDLQGQPRRERIERFFREARAAGAMNHPNIVTIHEVGEDKGRYFIAMEFLEGQTLRDRIGAVGPLPLSDAVHIAVSMADALDYAHQHGIIHRDIKPENIYLLNDGRVKLTDFGIARIDGESQLTVAGQVFGTPSYMSPEQIMGRDTDYRSDLFSLGVLLFEMLTGRKPFTTQGDTVVTITYRILNEPTPIAVGVGPALDAVIQHATAKDPSQRYRSAADFRAALLAAANARPVPSPLSPPPGYEPSYPPYNVQNPTMVGNPTIFEGNRQQATGNRGVVSGQWSVVGESPQHPTPNTQRQLTADHRPLTTATNRWAIIAILLVFLSVAALGGGYALVKAFQNQAAQSRQTAAAGLCNRGVELYNQKKYDEAIAVFQSVRQDPTTDARTRGDADRGETYCYVALAQNAKGRGDVTEATRWYQAAAKILPDDPTVKDLGASLQNPPAAPADGNVAAPVPAPTPPPLQSSYPTQGGPKYNQSDFTRANQQLAADAAALLQQGVDAYNAGDKSKALDLWQKAKLAGPGSSEFSRAERYYNNVAAGRQPEDDGGTGGGNNGGATP